MKKLLFVLNPCAGMRKANKILAEIIAVFNRANYAVTTYITEAQGDGEQFVMQQATDMDLVVCCGGDGTFNETVSGILKSGADVPIGYIPAGSTNDFAGSLKLPLDPLEAARQIVTGTPKALDLGQFGDHRFFSYVASFGAFTRTSYTTPQSIKNVLGHTAYLLSGIQEISQIRAIPVRLNVDGQIIEDKFIFGAICNSTSVGGILTLSPSLVDLQDGKFELLLVRVPHDLVELGECIRAIQRQQYNCKMITFLSGSHIQIQADPEMSWTLDGEWKKGEAEIEVVNMRRAYKLMLPGDAL